MNKIEAWKAAHPSAKNYPPEIAKLVFDVREDFALDQIISYFKANPGKTDAILIFGDDHHFERHGDKFPPKCIVIPSDFQIEPDPEVLLAPTSLNQSGWYGGPTIGR